MISSRNELESYLARRIKLMWSRGELTEQDRVRYAITQIIRELREEMRSETPPRREAVYKCLTQDGSQVRFYVSEAGGIDITTGIKESLVSEGDCSCCAQDMNHCRGDECCVYVSQETVVCLSKADADDLRLLLGAGG